MTKFREFLKSSFLAALGIVLPILLILIIFDRVVDALNAFTAPIAKSLFPEAYLDRIVATKLVTLGLIAVASMILGFIAQTSMGEKLGRWLEDHTLMHIKIYRTFKEFSERIIPSKTNSSFQPAILTRLDEMNTFILIVEELAPDHYVIFIPSAPSTLSGSIYVVPKTDVTLLPVAKMDVARICSRWGVGAARVLAEKNMQHVLQKSDRLVP
ncbi:hypothetical protein [Bdellovibrio sp. HCB337]|uniref:hypothetical protein n=1 Tax=Bdellovibrio sp. HCB337 TaxID=3394358 RepID=UPI0039A519DE